MGIYMGVFNMFIVLPQIVAALGGITWLNDLFYSGEISGTMQLAGWSCLLSGITVMFVSKEVG
jgi:maltose/moltooligosaccharide transporter